MSTGILNTSGLPQPILLDAIRFAETGHLSLNDARTAVSRKGAQGPYQFLQKNLHDMGYGMPQNITLADVQDPTKARDLASQYVTGYSNHHNFTSTLDKLVAYNMGPKAAVEWKAGGGRIEDLPNETKEYIERAAKFLASAPTDEGNTQMATQEYRPNVTVKQDLAMGPPFKYPENNANYKNASRTAEAQQTPADMINMALANASVDERRPDALDMQPTSPQSSSQGVLAALSPISSAQAATSDDGFPEPVLTTATKPAANTAGVLAASPGLAAYEVTNQRRNQSAMALPSAQIDNNELLMRVGLAGVGASQRGGLAAYEAMGQTYGDIMDINRLNGLEAYKAAMDNAGSGIKDTTGALVVNDAISRAMPLLNGWTTGIGSYLKHLPGTDAQKVSNLLATVQANIGFDKLQAMREASPTGGALGQVSERELSFLQGVFGSLEQSQTADELRYNLGLLQHVYNNIIHGPGNHSFAMPSYGTQQSDNSANMNEADEIVGLSN